MSLATFTLVSPFLKSVWRQTAICRGNTSVKKAMIYLNFTAKHLNDNLTCSYLRDADFL